MKFINRPVLVIVLLSALLRLGYFLLTLSENSITELFRSLPDTGVYWTAAQYYLNNNINGEYWLFQVGPGYALFITFCYKLFLNSLWGPYIFNLAAGILYPLFLYYFVNELFDNKQIAFVAGIVSACSLSAIVLSGNILTDQLFVTLVTAGLYYYVKSYNNELIKNQLIAGLLFVLAVSVRTALIWLPLMLVLFSLVKFFKRSNRPKSFIISTQLTTVITVAGILVLSGINYVSHDCFTPGGNGIKTARLRLAALAVANHDSSRTYADIISEWSWEDSVAFNHQLPSFAEEYNRDKDAFIEVVSTHPSWVAETFFTNVFTNMHEGTYIPEVQLPSYRSSITFLNNQKKNWFGYLLTLFSIAGIALLAVDKRYQELLLLGLVYSAFVLLSGFSMWQGSRLVFPAEITESALIAYFIVTIYSRIRSNRTS